MEIKDNRQHFRDKPKPEFGENKFIGLPNTPGPKALDEVEADESSGHGSCHDFLEHAFQQQIVNVSNELKRQALQKHKKNLSTVAHAKSEGLPIRVYCEIISVLDIAGNFDFLLATKKHEKVALKNFIERMTDNFAGLVVDMDAAVRQQAESRPPKSSVAVRRFVTNYQTQHITFIILALVDERFEKIHASTMELFDEQDNTERTIWLANKN